MNLMRTDIHRPSEINPADYQFVCVQYLWTKDGDIGEAIFNAEQKQVFWDHRAKTNGNFSSHEHGGTCYCCGAHARFVARYYHVKTNCYIDLGERCTEKMDNGEAIAFRKLRAEIKGIREFRAGKARAQRILAERNLLPAWTIWGSNKAYQNEEYIIQDIVSKLVRYGDISDKQATFLGTLLKQIETRVEREAKRVAEKASAADCPEGRMEVSGEVLSIKVQEGVWGTSYKMLVKHATGFTVWGTIPSAIISSVKRGQFVRFTATLKKSDKDEKFGFFSRPTKAEILSA